MSVVLSKCQPGVDDSSLPWPTATAETFTAMPTRHAARMCILSPPIEGPSKCQTGDDYLSLRRPFCSNAWPSLDQVCSRLVSCRHSMKGHQDKKPTGKVGTFANRLSFHVSSAFQIAKSEIF